MWFQNTEESVSKTLREVQIACEDAKSKLADNKSVLITAEKEEGKERFLTFVRNDRMGILYYWKGWEWDMEDFIMTRRSRL